MVTRRQALIAFGAAIAAPYVARQSAILMPVRWRGETPALSLPLRHPALLLPFRRCEPAIGPAQLMEWRRGCQLLAEAILPPRSGFEAERIAAMKNAERRLKATALLNAGAYLLVNGRSGEI